MRFFKIKTEVKIDDILNEFYKLFEYESHSILDSALKPYYSSRVGIHAYVKGNKVSGYYETGELTRTKSQLLRSKNWFYMCLEDNSKETIISGFIVGDPYLLCGIWVGVSGAIINCLKIFSVDNALGLFVISVIAIGFLASMFKKQQLLYDSIIAVLRKAKWNSWDNTENMETKKTGDGWR